MPTATLGFVQHAANGTHFAEFRGVLMQRNVCRSFNQYYDYAVGKGLLCSKIDSGGDCFNLGSMTGAALTVQKQKRIYKVDVLIGW